MKYAYSTNAERFCGPYDSKDEAVYEAIEEIVNGSMELEDALDRSFDIAEVVDPCIVTDVADMVLEHIYENASGEYGECTEGWLDGKELIKDLDNLIEPIIKKFIEDNDKPTFFGLDNTESLKVSDFPDVFKALTDDKGE